MSHVIAVGLAIMVLLTGCTGPGPTTSSSSPAVPPGYSFQFPSAPISTLVVDDYANSGTLTLPAGTEFGLELAGGGWTFPAVGAQEPFKLARGPGTWFPDTGYLGPGNCDSASPCGGDGAVFRTAGSGYSDVVAANGANSAAFDLHLVVKPGPITLDLQALPIPNEALGTGVTMPLGSTVNLHLIGNWAAPTPNTTVNGLFLKDGLKTTGVVSLTGVGHTFNETVYSYSVVGKGGCAFDFKYLDRSPFSNGYTIGFDIR
jgi:hypothetical protein